MTIITERSWLLNTGDSLSPLELAAWTVSSAMSTSPFPPPDATMYDLQKHRRTHYYHSCVGFLLLVLNLITLFERPLWCGDDSSCSAPDGGQIYLSDIPYLSQTLSLVVETALYAAVIWIEFGSTSPTWLFRFRVVLCTLGIADAAVYYPLRQLYRLAPFIRLSLTATSNTLLPTLTETYSILSPFANVMLLYVSSYVLFAWMMNIVLGDATNLDEIPRCKDEKDAQDVCPRSNEGFESISDALYTSILAATSSNYPSAFIPSYASYRSSGILWFVFFCTSNFLFLNLVLSVIYNEYSAKFKGRVLSFFERRVKGLKQAFFILEEYGGLEGHVSKERVVDLVGEVSLGLSGGAGRVLRGRLFESNLTNTLSPQLHLQRNEQHTTQTQKNQLNKIQLGSLNYLPPAQVDYLFVKLDKDGNNAIDLTEFCEFADSIKYSYVRVPSEGLFGTLVSNEGKYWINNRMPNLITGVLLVNAACIFLEDQWDAPIAWGTVESIFAAIYAIEILLRCTVANSFSMFWLETSK